MKQLLLPFDRLEEAARPNRATADQCIYCGSPAHTKDHVPPKVLLEEPYPLNLRTVPACRSCNEGWSLDEEYLAVVLASIGLHPSLLEKIAEGGKVGRALERSPGLDDMIVRSLAVDEDGRVHLQPDIGRIARILSKIAFGLFTLRYGRGPAAKDFRTLWVRPDPGRLPAHLFIAEWRWPGIRRKRATVVQKGVFSFVFAKGWMTKDAPLYCIVNLYSTLFGVVSCPAPIGRTRDRRLRSKPWE